VAGRGNRAQPQASSPEASYVWRRLHGGQIIAEAELVPGMGSWRVSGYRVKGPANQVAYAHRTLSLLTEAHRAADDLVRQEFSHVCRTGVCGRWLRWRQEEQEETDDCGED
jgi:hypothetical protein